MGTVTGYTAAKMDELEAASVINGAIVSGHLHLIQRDSTVIDAGIVVGPTGATGPTGPSSITACTSSTRPTGGSLFAGLYIFETDTKLTYVWTGTAWSYRGGLIICTSSTRPSTPIQGLSIYETDTEKLLVRNALRWNPAWNMPWGLVSPVISNASGSSFSTTPVDISGGGVTFTAVTNRYYKITATVEAISSDVNGDMGHIQIFDTGIISHERHPADIVNTGGITLVFPKVYTAGSVTILVKGYRELGTGHVDFARVGLFVEDMGPNGAPV